MNTIQKRFFPSLGQELDPLIEKERKFIQIFTLLDLPNLMKSYRWQGFGRRRKSRMAMAKASVAKSVYKIETTGILTVFLRNCKNNRLLCWWELDSQVPSLPTFSRAISEFATPPTAELQYVHEAMIKKYCCQNLAGHLRRGSTGFLCRY